MARLRELRRSVSQALSPPDVATAVHGRLAALIALVLVLVSAAIYAPTFVVPYDFVAYDDQVYVEGNPVVVRGLSAAGVRWAMTNRVGGNWHPLTILSHMLDVELYGLNPAGHHLSSALLHAVNGALVFMVLWRMTASLWPSALVAALFAWHPLRVESVAWVAERKDVLSLLMMLLALAAYTRYARHLGWQSYLATTILFALGLMAKPMLVTLPFVLMLLDVWPLQRWSPGSLSRRDGWVALAKLFLEKLPWLALSAADIAVTLRSQEGAFSNLSFVARLANAIHSYYAYLAKIFFPYPLHVQYLGVATEPSIPRLLAEAAGLLLISVAAVAAVKRWPFFTVGWFWFLGTLVPVIGIVQVGAQSMADRYTYIPTIGIYIILAWSLSALAARGTFWRRASVCGALAVLPLIIALSGFQVTRWRNSETLFAHTLRHSPDNYLAVISLGVAALNRGDYELALSRATQAADLMPASRAPVRIAAVSLGRLGRTQEAIAAYVHAIEVFPDDPMLKNDLARILATCDDARVRNGQAALQLARLANQTLEGQNPKVLDTLATAYAELGAYDAAISTTNQALFIARQFVGAGHADVQPLVAGLEYRRTLYRQRQPYHVPLGVWEF